MRRNQKSKVLEKTPIAKIFFSLRNFFSLTRQTTLLPIPFYTVLEIIRLLQSTMCLLLTDLRVVWDGNESVKNIFHFLQVFWRFSADAVTIQYFQNSFIAIVILYFVFYIPLTVFFVLFKIRGKLSIPICFTTCLFNEIFFPIICSWTVSQLASVLSMCIIDPNYRTVFIYVQIIVYIILIAYHMFYAINLSNNEAAYMKGRSLTWSYQTQRAYLIITLLILFLSRFIETLDKIGSIIFAVLTGLVALFMILYVYMASPFIHPSSNSYHLAFLTSCLVGFVMQMISLYVIRIDIAIVLTVVALLTIIMYVVYSQLHAMRVSRSIAVLDAIASSEVTFSDSFKTPNQFLFIVRQGFQNGHFFVLNWQPFIQAVERWPKEVKIWIQWIRFIAIYADQNHRLEQILAEMADHKFKDLSTKYIISQVKLIQNSRNRHITHDLKQSLKALDDKLHVVKNLVSTYWNEIEEGSSNSAYDIAKKLSQMLSSIQTEYLHLISLWPNNYSIASKYASFMLNIVSDPLEGQFWTNRARVLKDKNQIITDSTQDFGFDCFPFIPRSLKDCHNDSMESTGNFVRDNDIHSISIGDKSSDTSNSDPDNGLDSGNNEINTAPSHILKLGQQAKVPFISRLLIIVAIFFVIAFICDPFVPPTMVIITLSQYRRLFNAVKSVSDIHASLSKVAFFILYKALEVKGIFAVHSVVGDIISITNSEMLLLNNRINFLQSSFGDHINLDSTSGDYMKTVDVTLILRDGSKYNSTLFEALNSVAAAAFKFSSISDGQSFVDEDWMTFFFSNTRRLQNILQKLTVMLCADMNKIRDEKVSTIDFLLYVVIAIEVILIPIFVIFILQIRSNWNYILDTINSIPRVAIQKAIQKYSTNLSKDDVNSGVKKGDGKENERLNLRKEFRYQSAFVQMVSSRDTSGGVPVKAIVSVYIFNFVISIVCVISIILMINILRENLTAIPIQYYNAADASYVIYDSLTLLFRKAAVDSEGSFAMATRNDIAAEAKETYGTMTKMVNTLIFGTYENKSAGAISSSRSISDALIMSRGDPFESDELLESQQWKLYPNFAGIEILNEMYMRMEQSIMSPSFNILEKKNETWTIVDLAIGTIIPTLVENILLDSNDLFEDKMLNTNMLLFVLGAALFIVGTLSITWLFLMLMQVKGTVRFVLSSLSMIDTAYVQEMQNVMNLFYGKTSGIVPTNQTLQRTFSEVESLIPELVVELNNQLRIVSINERLIDNWELEKEQLNNSHINLIMTFEDTMVLKKLTAQAAGIIGTKEPLFFDTEATLNATKKKINVSFSSSFVSRGSETKLVLMIGSNLNSGAKRKIIEELNSHINAIKMDTIPLELRSKLSVQTERFRFTTHYLIFAAIEMMNLNEYSKDHTAKETREFFKTFVREVEATCQKSNYDAVVMKYVGTTILVCFNMVQQNTNYYKSAQESYDFVKAISVSAFSKGYQIRSSLSAAKSAVTALSAKGTLNFDVYAKSIQPMLMMLRSAEKNQLLFSTKMRDFLPPDIAADAEEVEVPKINQESEWVFMLNVGVKPLQHLLQML